MFVFLSFNNLIADYICILVYMKNVLIIKLILLNSGWNHVQDEENWFLSCLSQHKIEVKIIINVY
jgi:hypothetical protein